MSYDTIGARLRAVRGSMSRAKFAKLVGVSPNTFGRFEKDRRTPSMTYIQKVARAFDLDVGWLTDNRGPVPACVASWVPDESDDDGEDSVAGDDDPVDPPTVMLPLMAPRLGAGEGDHGEDEVAGSFPMLPEHAARLGHPRITLRAAVVRGDSMEPLLHDGDVVVFVRDPEARDAVCVVAIKGAVLVKRVQTLGDKLRIVSENPFYEPREYGPGDDVRVIGRVVWRGQMGAR